MGGKRIVVDGETFVGQAVNWILAAIEESLQQRGVCHLMLAGGGTPIPVYRALASRELPWRDLVLYFGDERCVPPDHDESNYRAVIQALFPRGLPAGVRIHRMRGEDDPQTAAAAYEKLLPKRIDVLLLGMGGDGHTASLFPGSPALKESARSVMSVIGAKPPPQRLSITPPVIAAARNCLVLAQGEGKAGAVKRALEQGDLPVALAAEGDWLMDRAAAAGLSGI
jgi:6-phosphogluconolactonase